MRLTRPSFFFLWGLLISFLGFGQNAVSQRDPTAAALAVKSYLKLTGGNSIQDASIVGSAAWIAGSDHEQGQVTLKVRGIGESRVGLRLGGTQRSEVRGNSESGPVGKWADADGRQHSMATHNCWTDAGWFFPAAFSVFSVSDSSLVLYYVGREAIDGTPVEHIRMSHRKTMGSAQAAALAERLSSMDVYLDANALLPVSIAFSMHPDEDAGGDIHAEIRFSEYKPVSGILVPFRVQKFINNGLLLDVTVQTVSINSGLSDADFGIQ